jgi:ADP-ribose pyrophosphatase YjhB (NUDIX family)
MRRHARYQGAIVRDHHVLLVKHTWFKDGNEYWLLPGGGKIPEESEEQCVRREMLEETHLKVRIKRLLLDEPAHDDVIYERYKTYLCTILEGDAQPGHEPEPEESQAYAITELAWFDLRDETTWDAALTPDSLVYAQLQRIRAELGHSSSPDRAG